MIEYVEQIFEKFTAKPATLVLLALILIASYYLFEKLTGDE